MKKKGLVITLSITTTLSLLTFPCLVGINAFMLPSVYEDTFLGELKYKIKRLKETDGKRIVIISGSSAPFGIRSDLIKEKLFDYDVVNFGMYASLGSNVMLDFSKVRINEGDIVLFMPEQHIQTLSMYYNGASLWQALDGDFSSLSLLPSATRQRLYGDLYSFSQSKFKYTFQDKINLGDTVYQRSSFDEFGDIKKELTPYNNMVERYDPTNMISFDNSMINEEFINYVNEYATYIRSKKANLYYYFAPMNTLAIEDETKIDAYYDELQAQLNFDILGNPHDSVMDAEWFYDTNFHLNGSGSTVFTKKVIQNLKLLLNDTSQTDIPLPDKPSIPEIEVTDGDNSHEDYFTYQELDDTCVITGIKEVHEKMIVPFKHNDKRVVSFKPQVFASHPEIKEIYIQENIRYIFDYSFSGCTQLEKIHLSNKKPSSINFGSHLLDGTDANIYVPKDVYSKYVTDYRFGGMYGLRIKSE